MQFAQPLVPARLIRRYKRFLVDCALVDGSVVTAHCANPGSMTGLAEPNTKIWLEPVSNPKRKLKFAWRLVEHDNGGFTGVDTSLPNRILRAALETGQIASLAIYTETQTEVPYGSGSRVDFLLRAPDRPAAYVEVKSVTLSRTPGIAEFPDCVTVRGAKHLRELASVARAGHRAIAFYLVQRTDAERFAVAKDIDPTYAAQFEAARADGVEVMAFGTRISPESVQITSRLTLA